MKCQKCHGAGCLVYDDDEAVQCMYCWGKGSVPLWLAYRDFQYRVIGVRIDLALGRLKYTRMGTRWWKRYGLERHARELAAGKTSFELAAIHGERLNRLRKFADFIEQKGFNVGHNYRVETRLVAEAARAIEIARSRKTEPNH